MSCRWKKRSLMKFFFGALLFSIFACGSQDKDRDTDTDTNTDEGGADSETSSQIDSGTDTETDPGDEEEIGDVSSFTIGDYLVTVTQGRPGRLEVQDAADDGRLMWKSAFGSSVVFAQRATFSAVENRGSLDIEDPAELSCEKSRIDEASKEGESVVIKGSLLGEGCEASFSLTLAAQEDHVSLEATLEPGETGLNRVLLRAGSTADEKIFGFGEQFSELNLKGRSFPIVVQEQGIGRGDQPTTTSINAIYKGVGGSWLSTYFPMPYYLTDSNTGFVLENTQVSFFDLSADDKTTIKLVGTQMRGRILRGKNPLEIIESLTAYTGRMDPLPDWIGDGAVVGMQGGTAEVRAKLAELDELGCPIAAFWLQDWVGKRITIFGSQLWWNWEVDDDQYPGWEELVSDLEAEGIRMMVYVSPYIADVSVEKTNVKRNLYTEAAQEGYLVVDAQGEPYKIQNTDFDAGMIDLTNPDAAAWYKNVISEQVLGAGASGWMADYGESLPLDAALHSGADASAYHNEYPVRWAELNKSLLEEEGRLDDVVFFTRSGYTGSQGYSRLFWLGDQTVDWGENDGIKSVVKGLLSGGISGVSLNHADIGGYTTLDIFKLERSKELLLRWMELSAFTPIYRTHEGNQPENNAQFYSDGETYSHFTKFAKVYAAAADYRKTLMEEAASRGWPLVRHTALHYPDDPEAWKADDQWLLGSDILVAPVVNEAARMVAVYFPKGKWRQIWSGEEYGNESTGEWEFVDAPLGEPAVFEAKGSAGGARFLAELKAMGLIDWYRPGPGTDTDSATDDDTGTEPQTDTDSASEADTDTVTQTESPADTETESVSSSDAGADSDTPAN